MLGVGRAGGAGRLAGNGAGAAAAEPPPGARGRPGAGGSGPEPEQLQAAAASSGRPGPHPAGPAPAVSLPSPAAPVYSVAGPPGSPRRWSCSADRDGVVSVQVPLAAARAAGASPGARAADLLWFPLLLSAQGLTFASFLHPHALRFPAAGRLTRGSCSPAFISREFGRQVSSSIFPFYIPPSLPPTPHQASAERKKRTRLRYYFPVVMSKK